MSNDRKLWGVFLWTIALSMFLLVIMSTSAEGVLFSPSDPAASNNLPLAAAVTLLISFIGNVILFFVPKTVRREHKRFR